MEPRKRKRQCEELAVWNERLLAWEAHKKSGALPRKLLEWCMDNGVSYSGMQKRAKAWSKMGRAEKDEQVRKGALRTGAKRAVKGGKFGAVAEKLIAYTHLSSEINEPLLER